MKEYIIRKKIFFGLIFLIFFFIFILSTLEFSMIINILQEKEIENIADSSNLAQKNIENLLKQINALDEIFYENEDILQSLVNEKNIDFLNSFLNMMVKTNPFIEDIYFIKKDSVIGSTNEKTDYKSIIQLPTKSEKISTDTSNIFFNTQLYNIENKEVIGTLLVQINKQALQEVFINSSIGKDEIVIIIDENNNILFQHPYNIDLTNKITTNYQNFHIIKDKLYLKSQIKYSSWTSIRIIPLSEIYHKFKAIFLQIILFVLILTIVVLISLYKFIMSFTNPIIQLCDKFKELEKGNFDVRVDFKRKDEIGELGRSFNNMATKIKILIEEKFNIQEKKNKLEFQALQAQMNPHFLYNILDSVKWMAIINNVPVISKMINNIINLLKYNISFSENIVSIKDELTNVKHYIEIQKYRYGDNFEIQYLVDDEHLNCKILKLTLQPIVENAFIHGFQQNKILKLTIKSTKLENLLIIEIKDNGKGLQLTKEKGNKTSTGIGLDNINERIALYFGNEYGLFVKTDNGTIAKVILPFSQ